MRKPSPGKEKRRMKADNTTLSSQWQIHVPSVASTAECAPPRKPNQLVMTTKTRRCCQHSPAATYLLNEQKQKAIKTFEKRRRTKRDEQDGKQNTTLHRAPFGLLSHPALRPRPIKPPQLARSMWHRRHTACICKRRYILERARYNEFGLQPARCIL